MSNICPVCKYHGLSLPPYNKYGHGSDEVCPCCGFQFGLDEGEDKEKAYAEWHDKWMSNGCKWFSRFRRPPAGWMPVLHNPKRGRTDE